MSDPTPRRRVDLRVLPKRVQYAIAAAVIVPIAILGWLVGHDQPTPDWITQLLIPALGVVLIVGFLVTLLDGFRQGRSERKDRS